MKTDNIQSTIYASKINRRKTLNEENLILKRSKSDDSLCFSPITSESMNYIWPYLLQEKGRTTDFSYAGILMWVDYFDYEYCIAHDTLFIKGRKEGDITETAFSMPIGNLPLDKSIELLRRYCDENNQPLVLSAVPARGMTMLKELNPLSIEPLPDWADYLYDAEALATLKGKKYNKKRNHVNQFKNTYPDWSLIPLTPENTHIALSLMDQYDHEGDNTPMAIAERELTRRLIALYHEHHGRMVGAILMAGDIPCAFTIGDMKEDTLFIHVEKAIREFPGSFEMINMAFAQYILSKYPMIKYINREDDSGDEGLRQAKESYHPLLKLNKYNINF